MKKVSLLSLVLFLALMLLIPIQASALHLANESDPWMQKPVLSYLLLTKDERLEQESRNFFSALNLSKEEIHLIQQIALAEQAQLQDLYTKTQAIALNESSSLVERKKAIQATHYNKYVLSMMMETDHRLKDLLGSRYPVFRKWIYEWWQREQKAVIQLKGSGHPQDQPPPLSVAYSCWMFATQYNGYTNEEIALPDKYVKFANLGWYIPPPYNNWYASPPYTVDIYRNPYWVWGVLVREVGPWNIDDNYWDTATSTPPRRMFGDLPLCWSEAEYAYFYGYNGGRDQFGRIVTNPSSVDLTPTIAARLGLGYLQNSWLWVYYYDLP